MESLAINGQILPASFRCYTHRIFASYRLLLIIGLSAAFFVQLPVSQIGLFTPDLYRLVIVLYLLFSIQGFISVWFDLGKHSGYLGGCVTLDLIFLTLIIYASGGVDSGLTVLYNVVIIFCGILLPVRMALFFASFASLLFMLQQAFFTYYYYLSWNSMIQVGIHSTSFLLMAVLTTLLMYRLGRHEIALSHHSRNIQHLEALNKHIVQRLKSAVFLVDSQWRINPLNHAAYLIFGERIYPANLNALAPDLYARVFDWLHNGMDADSTPFHIHEEGPLLVQHCYHVDNGGDRVILLFLDEMTDTLQRAQQLKLASLGRLTASIAHELRNPLGAISHAGQLLNESLHLNKEEKSLIRIIGQQSKRMNEVIKNVLQLSRRHHSAMEILNINTWLPEFVESFRTTEPELISVELDIPEKEVCVFFDSQELYQVVSNLSTNGLRYSRQATGSAKIKIKVGWLTERPQAYLDVIDYGQGVRPAVLDYVFEPFFSTERNEGTGLGLYIAKELCEANQAMLVYQRRFGYTCFRIRFQMDKMSTLTS